MPLTIGGGIKNLSLAERILEQGADKVSLNSELFNGLYLIEKISSRFGSQAVVASIDYIRKDNEYFIFNNQKKRFLKSDIPNFAKDIENAGCGEILLTNVHLDGTAKGLDFNLAKSLCNKVNVPIIISGGCGKAIHIVDAFKTHV